MPMASLTLSLSLAHRCAEDSLSAIIVATFSYLLLCRLQPSGSSVFVIARVLPAPSLKTPTESMPRLPYPDPAVSIDDNITKGLSNKAQVSPAVEASQTLLVTLPNAVAHLVDPQASPHLASGPFSLVRLDHGGNIGIAVFARVGKELQWPLTKDQAAVKLDPFHYFFSVKVPPEIEEECRASSPEKRRNGEQRISSSSSDESLLNYGITFSASSDMACLQKLDEALKQYCYFKAPQVTSQLEEKEGGDKAENNRVMGATATVPAEDYWTLLAPNVEDYSSSTACAIVSGAGHVIRGIFWISDATVSQLEKGNSFMQGRVKTKEAPSKISPSAMRGMERAQRISAMSAQIAAGVLSGILKAAAFITRPLLTSKVGQKLLSTMPGQVAVASLEGFEKIGDALEVGGKSVLTTTSTSGTGLVEQRYGNEAGQFTERGFNAVGGFLTTALYITKLQDVFYSSILAAKVGGSERRLKDESTKDSQIGKEEMASSNSK